jgi:hypothetical protein
MTANASCVANTPFGTKGVGAQRRGDGCKRAISPHEQIAASTSLSCSAPLPGARVTFSCVVKRKSPKRRPPREHALRTSMCSGFARGRRGSPKVHPCACGELAHILCATLRAFPSSARRVRGAPVGAPPARAIGQGGLFDLASNEARMAVLGAELSSAVHDAAAHSRSSEQGAHVRAQGCESSRRRAIGEHQGQSSRHDAGETVMPARNGFGYFPRKESNPRAWRRAESGHGRHVRFVSGTGVLS